MPAALTYTVSADTRRFEQAMSHARDVAIVKSGEILTQFQRASKGIESSFESAFRFTGVRNAVLGLAGVVVAYQATSAGVRAASAEMERYIALQKQARDTGVSVAAVDQFQRIAQQMHVEVQSFDKILSELRAATKSGFLDRGNSGEGAIERFQGFLPEGALQRYQLSRDAGNQEAQNRQLLELTQHIQGNFGELAAQDFAGRFSQTLADGLRAGSIQIDELVAKLQSVGETPGIDEQAKRAEDLSRRIADAKREIDEFLKISQALVEIGYLGREAWAWILTDFANGAKAAADLIATLGRIPAYLNSFRPAVAEGVAQVNAQNALRGMTPDKIAAARDQSYRLDFRELGGDAPLPPARPGFFPNAEKEPAAPRAPAAERLDPVETYVNSLEKAAAALRAEADSFGKSNAAKAIAIDLAKAYATAEANGAEVTEEQASRIRAAATETATYKDRIAELTAAQERAAETAKYFGNAISNSFADAIVDGKSFEDILKGLEKQLARSAIQGLIMGTGPFAVAPAAAGATGTASAGGILGALLSAIPRFARGGVADRPAIFGDAGPEAAVPLPDGRRIPVDIRVPRIAEAVPRQAAAGGGGGDMSYTHAPVYQITGASPQQVMAMIQAYDGESQRNFSARARAARMRGY